MTRPEWKVSLHGGHSGEYCEHAEDPLREVLEAAVRCGYHTFGVTEHAPRSQERFLYDTERAKGYTVARLRQEFEAYAEAAARLAEEFSGRLTVLRGFEAEIVPAESWLEEMRRHRHRFEYVVGSVHYVGEISIDGPPEDFHRAMESAGGLEALAVRYYDAVAGMIEMLRPEVVGHLDLIRRNAPPGASLATAEIRRAAVRALEAARAHGAILDLNTAGWRKGLGAPYPAPWLVRLADSIGVPFCFGDDSHGASQVGQDVDRGREYLLANGVQTVTALTRRDGALVRKQISLAP